MPAPLRARFQALLDGHVQDLLRCEEIQAIERGRALGEHRGLSPDALQWFTHHAEVDLAHAEQGLDEVVHFATHYGLSDDDAMTLLEMALRENVFVKRYFGAEALARLRGLST